MMPRPALLINWSISAEANARLLHQQVFDLEVRLNDEVEKSARLERQAAMLRQQIINLEVRLDDEVEKPARLGREDAM